MYFLFLRDLQENDIAEVTKDELIGFLELNSLWVILLIIKGHIKQYVYSYNNILCK